MLLFRFYVWWLFLILGYPGGDSASYINLCDWSSCSSENEDETNEMIVFIQRHIEGNSTNCPRGWCSERNHPWLSEDGYFLNFISFVKTGQLLIEKIRSDPRYKAILSALWFFSKFNSTCFKVPKLTVHLSAKKHNYVCGLLNLFTIEGFCVTLICNRTHWAPILMT